MNQVRTFKVKSSLSRQMAGPGGRSIGSAVQQAEAAVESHRDAAMANIERTLSELEATCAAPLAGSERQIYSKAMALLDLAGFFDTGPLYAAAYSLCEISDRMGPTTWDWPSVNVHLRALRFILGDQCRDSEMSRSMIEGLRVVTKRKGPPAH